MQPYPVIHCASADADKEIVVQNAMYLDWIQADGQRCRHAIDLDWIQARFTKRGHLWLRPIAVELRLSWITWTGMQDMRYGVSSPWQPTNANLRVKRNQLLLEMSVAKNKEYLHALINVMATCVQECTMAPHSLVIEPWFYDELPVETVCELLHVVAPTLQRLQMILVNSQTTSDLISKIPKYSFAVLRNVQLQDLVWNGPIQCKAEKVLLLRHLAQGSQLHEVTLKSGTSKESFARWGEVLREVNKSFCDTLIIDASNTTAEVELENIKAYVNDLLCAVRVRLRVEIQTVSSYATAYAIVECFVAASGSERTIAVEVAFEDKPLRRRQPNERTLTDIQALAERGQVSVFWRDSSTL